MYFVAIPSCLERFAFPPFSYAGVDNDAERASASSKASGDDDFVDADTDTAGI